MMFKLIILVHWIGTLWHYLNYLEQFWKNEDENIWLDEKNIRNAFWWQKYAECYYYGITTVMLIGSTTFTFEETLFTAFTLMFTVSMFAYLISKISMIIEEINKDSQEYKQDLEVINRYFGHKNICNETKSKVRGFLEYLYSSQSELKVSHAAIKVLEKLPRNIKSQIGIEINQTHIKKFSLIFNNFSPKTQDLILERMEEQTFITNEYIFQQNQIQDISIYLITKGKVEFQHIINKRTFPVCLNYPDQTIGYQSFFSNQPYQFSAQCKSIVSVCKIKIEEFMNVISKNPQDLQIYMMLKDKIKFQTGLYANYSRKCRLCNSILHDENNCNLVLYRPNKWFLLLKYTSHTDQPRRRYFRTDYRSPYPLNEKLYLQLDKVKDKLYFHHKSFQEYSKCIPTLSSENSFISSDQDYLDYSYSEEPQTPLNYSTNKKNISSEYQQSEDQNNQVKQNQNQKLQQLNDKQMNQQGFVQQNNQNQQQSMVQQKYPDQQNNNFAIIQQGRKSYVGKNTFYKHQKDQRQSIAIQSFYQRNEIFNEQEEMEGSNYTFSSSSDEQQVETKTKINNNKKKNSTTLNPGQIKKQKDLNALQKNIQVNKNQDQNQNQNSQQIQIQVSKKQEDNFRDRINSTQHVNSQKLQEFRNSQIIRNNVKQHSEGFKFNKLETPQLQFQGSQNSVMSSLQRILEIKGEKQQDQAQNESITSRYSKKHVENSLVSMISGNKVNLQKYNKTFSTQDQIKRSRQSILQRDFKFEDKNNVSQALQNNQLLQQQVQQQNQLLQQQLQQQTNNQFFLKKQLQNQNYIDQKQRQSLLSNQSSQYIQSQNQQRQFLQLEPNTNSVRSSIKNNNNMIKEFIKQNSNISNNTNNQFTNKWGTGLTSSQNDFSKLSISSYQEQIGIPNDHQINIQFFLNFEKCLNWEYYFPLLNLNNNVKAYQRLILKKQKLKAQSGKKSKIRLNKNTVISKQNINKPKI